ncbi:hypothetical protein [Streptomyces collinus]|uniref:hypothetical protein n=1 Tax=Streptomyces collinus TaxID=42684 RepID=UPI0036A1D3EF
MKRTLTATASVLAALILAGCSDSSSSDSKPSPAASHFGSGFNSAKYLYGLDGDKHSRRQIDALLTRLHARCSDDVGVLTMAATNTATDITGANGTQTTYGVLETLAAGLPSSGRVSCKDRLPSVEKELKAGR